jgi:branched-subunit amino acid aminotransferase/4-amino-4-deoxychorismate lyase
VKGGYILLNGTFHREKDLLYSSLDLHRLGEGIKESFRAENNLILFAEDNCNYLLKAISEIGFTVPKEWDLPRLRHDVSRLLNKNHLFLAARVHICFFPRTDQTDYLLYAEEIPRGYYPLNEPGLMIDFYDEGLKSDTRLNCFEASSRFLWISAAKRALSKSKHNLIIFNNKGNACEGISASFCYIKDDTAVFPASDSFGYQPPLNEKIIKCAKSCGFKISRGNEISREDLLNAEEIFLIDNCLGIQKVLGLGDRRYYSQKTTSLALKLKELAVKEGAE